MNMYSEWIRLRNVLSTHSLKRTAEIQTPWIHIKIMLFGITLFCFQWEEKYVDLAVLGFWFFDSYQ